MVPISTIVAGCLLVLSSGCACDAEDVARGLAGDDARQCGRARVGEDPAEVDACVLEAFRAGQAFTARYDLMGIDSSPARVIAFRAGVFWDLIYDSDPCGGDSCGAKVEGAECDEVAEQEIDGRITLVCAAPGRWSTHCD